PARVTLLEEGHFQFIPSVLSDRIYQGTWQTEGQLLTLKDVGGEQFVFQMDDGLLVFCEKESSALPTYRGERPISNGAIFTYEKMDRGIATDERDIELLTGKTYHDLTNS